MLYCFYASLSDVLSIPWVISCFHVYLSYWHSSGQQFGPVWRSTVIKSLLLHWKLIGIIGKRLSYMSDFNTGWCHNSGGCLLIFFCDIPTWELCNLMGGLAHSSYLSCLFSPGCIARCHCQRYYRKEIGIKWKKERIMPHPAGCRPIAFPLSCCVTQLLSYWSSIPFSKYVDKRAYFPRKYVMSEFQS